MGFLGYSQLTVSGTVLGLPAQNFGRAERRQLYGELKDCIDLLEPIDGKPLEEVVQRVKSAGSSLRRVLLSPAFSELLSDDGWDDMDEDAPSDLSVRVKLNVTVHSEGLQTVRVLSPLTKEAMNWTSGFPTKKWGSDHISLVAEFSLTRGAADQRSKVH